MSLLDNYHVHTIRCTQVECSQDEIINNFAAEEIIRLRAESALLKQTAAALSSENEKLKSVGQVVYYDGEDSTRKLIERMYRLESLLREAREMISSHEVLCGCIEQEECIKRIDAALGEK